jgi:hypothetical protein
MTTMKVRILSAALLFGLLAAGSAEAMVQENGLSRNGWRTNGIQVNGIGQEATLPCSGQQASCAGTTSEVDFGALVVLTVKLPTPAGQPR